MTYKEASALYYEWASQFSGDPQTPNETLSEQHGGTWYLHNVNGPLAVVTADGNVYPVAEFWAAYVRMAEEGKCDSPGGAEYRRVLLEWIDEQPENMEEFIAKRANAGPDDFYTNAAATAAAAFVHNCLMHRHRGVLDCDDKTIIFGNDGYTMDSRSRTQVRLMKEILTQHGLEASEFAANDYSWAIVIYNYERRQIDHTQLERQLRECWCEACEDFKD